MLRKEGVKHEVLNAKFHDRESDIVAQAGRSAAVTISTNMAGRGTDIVLGGNPEMLARQLLEREGFERYDSDTELLIKSVMLNKMDDAAEIADRLEGLPENVIPKLQALRDEARADHDKVKSLGGLHIIGTERHESRRIDNQLRGRAGRQGDPGSSRFFVSFEDDLMRLFASDRMLGVMDRLGMDDSQPIEARMVSGAIERAQKRVEDRNFGIRKQLLDYDNVMSKQREVIYAQRREVLLGSDMREAVLDMFADFVDAQVQRHLNPELEPEERDVATLRGAIVEAIPQLESFDFEELRIKSPDDATDMLVPIVEEHYSAREQELGENLMRQLERFIVLQVVDQHWKEQLHNMDVLRQGIGLRGYGQRNPLQEYAFEAFNLFEEMTGQIKMDVARLLFRVQVQVNQPLQRQPDPRSQARMSYDSGDMGSMTATPMPTFGDSGASAGAAAPRARQEQAAAPEQQGLNRAQRRRQEKLARKADKASD